MDKKTLMAKASGKQPAQLVFKNANLVNVFTSSVSLVDIAVEDGLVIGIGDYHGEKEIDLKKRFVAPGFIDGHVHIESSMVTPPQFASIIMPKGTTTIIADPHEIANVKGMDGVLYMVKASKRTPLDVFMMIPSSVPATDFETAGAEITPQDIKNLRDVEGIHGLGEVMNYPGVLAGEKDIHEKIAIMDGRMIDGHAPGVSGNALNAYITAGVRSDHECSTVAELTDRLDKGMYVHLREGSVTRNVRTLLNGVHAGNLHRVLFCTDDKHPEDIHREGHINFNVNLAIDAGFDPIDAIKMATLHAAQCYGLKRHGAVAPGYLADFIVFDDLSKIEPSLVYKNGILVAKNNRYLIEPEKIDSNTVKDSVNVNTKNLDFTLKLIQSEVKVIGLIKNNITTRKLRRTVKVKQGVYQNQTEQDILKLAVIERHKGTGNIGLGLVEGFGFKNGALAMTIAHDSHNLVVVGDDDVSMKLAAETIVDIGGGIVLIKDKKVYASLSLEIAGIMTEQNPLDVGKKLDLMKAQMRTMGLSEAIDDPFIQLAFLPLAVIPSLKLTDKGLFDVETFTIVPIEWGEA